MLITFKHFSTPDKDYNLRTELPIPLPSVGDLVNLSDYDARLILSGYVERVKWDFSLEADAIDKYRAMVVICLVANPGDEFGGTDGKWVAEETAKVNLPPAPTPTSSKITDDPTDPDLGHGVDAQPVPQNKKYLVLSEAERAKGWVRPYRDTYRHVGIRPKHPLRDLTAEEHERYDQFSYVKFEAYPDSDNRVTGRYWTAAQLTAHACGQTTTMGRAISETYCARPDFYGSTYCCTCSKHLPVEEFVWQENGQDTTVVGS